KKHKGRGQPEIKNRRNSGIADRRSLEIDPGEIEIAAPGAIDLADPATGAPIHFLGQVRMQDDGQLLFLPGLGQSAAAPSAAPIEEYANNDGWFDDMCDGVIRADVTFPDGHKESAE